MTQAAFCPATWGARSGWAGRLRPQFSGDALSDRRQTLWDKVMRRVVVLPCGCWLWTGPNSGKGRGGGYPRMNVDGATMAVHIVMWIIRNGPIPPKKQLDHNCVNRMCVNPDHTVMMTHKKNQRLRAKRAKLQQPFKEAA